MRRCAVLRAANDSGPRKASWIHHIVLHSTEGGSAESVATYFSRPTTQASTQLVVDDHGCYRCVPDLTIPWGAPGANRSGLHIEHCGYARWTRADWLTHLPMLKLSAEHAAEWCWKYRIPRRVIGPQRLKWGVAGFVTHKTCTLAFGTAGGHTDPGAGFPLDTYMTLVRTAYVELADERRRTSR